MKINIGPATPDTASHIASLIMEAMNPGCCQNLAGAHHTLAEFHQVMERLVRMEDSQYSYRNTLLATNSEGITAGIIVSYDGAKLKALRQRFIEEAKATFGIDYTGMDPETQEGELYIDSLAVPAAFRGKGIAKMLLNAVIEKGREMGLPAVGLLVYKGNPKAERLYANMGFEYVNDAVWGGHSMKHLQYPLR